MTNTYFIRGTISVQVRRHKPKIWITPCVGFLTPDKQKMIAFPVRFNGTIGNAKVIKWSKDKQFQFVFEAKAIKANIPSLLAVAAQQKPIELRLEEFTKTAKIKITGFVFPAPSDHAHGC